MINIVIPMAGEGSRFKNAGFHTPKPFIQFGGKMMIKWVIENLNTSFDHRFIFLIKNEHLGSYYGLKFMNEILPTLPNNSLIIPVYEKTEGTACTLLLAKEYINNDDRIVIANSDQFIEWVFDDFIKQSRGWGGNIATFKANDPKWSYAKVKDGRVIEVAEKKPVSDNATCGVYYWSRGKDFVEAAEKMIKADDRFNDEFYTCPVFNYYAPQKTVGIYEVEKMWGLGTPPDLLSFINKKMIPEYIKAASLITSLAECLE